MTRPLATFIPPHCPRSHCRFHRCADGWRWIRFGAYSRRCEPRRIPRFRCGHCRATFSSQTFSTTYYLKRPELLEPIAHRLLACSGYRQIAREARCNPTTVMGQAARLGRHALLCLHELKPKDRWPSRWSSTASSRSPTASTTRSTSTTPSAPTSHFTYAFTFARLRRKGTMTPAQKNRRARLEATARPPRPQGPRAQRRRPDPHRRRAPAAHAALR